MIERVTHIAAAQRKRIIMKRTFTDFKRTKTKRNAFVSCVTVTTILNRRANALANREKTRCQIKKRQ